MHWEVLCCYICKRENSGSDLGFDGFIVYYSIDIKCWLTSDRHLDDPRGRRTGLAGDPGLQLGLLQKAWLISSCTSAWVWQRPWVTVRQRNVSAHSCRKLVSDMSKSTTVWLEVPLLAVCGNSHVVLGMLESRKVISLGALRSARR